MNSSGRRSSARRLAISFRAISTRMTAAATVATSCAVLALSWRSRTRRSGASRRSSPRNEYRGDSVLVGQLEAGVSTQEGHECRLPLTYHDRRLEQLGIGVPAFLPSPGRDGSEDPRVSVNRRAAVYAD